MFVFGSCLCSAHVCVFANTCQRSKFGEAKVNNSYEEQMKQMCLVRMQGSSRMCIERFFTTRTLTCEMT